MNPPALVESVTSDANTNSVEIEVRNKEKVNTLECSCT